jgi:coenzyme F420 hydrogenase subunit beta
MKKIKKVIDNNLCLGCGLCESLISDCELKINKKGFFEPKFLNSIDNYKKKLTEIEKICPSINITVEKNTNNNLLWGNIDKIHRGYSNNPEIRYKGSSGGVLTQAAVSLLESGKVDKVLQIGANKITPIFNETYLNESSEDVLTCGGSRYSPSKLLSNIKEELSLDEKFLIIGKPCDISAVKNYVKNKIEFKEKIIYTMSFFCAGIPSHNATLELVSNLGVKKPDEINSFKYRGGGWPGEVQVSTKEGFSNECSYEDSWGKLLGRDLNKRCKICPDGIGLEADFVCADSWESSNGYPDFEDKPGYSLIISRNKKGTQLLDYLIGSNSITIENTTIDEIKQVQPYQWHRIVFLGSRLLGARIKGYTFNFKGVNIIKKMFLGSLKLHIVNFIGILKRI